MMSVHDAPREALQEHGALLDLEFAKATSLADGHAMPRCTPPGKRRQRPERLTWNKLARVPPP